MSNNIVLGDAREIKNYPDTPYHLTITSPPYFVGKEYEQDYSFAEYRELLRVVFQNVAERTVPGGKIVINIADIAAFSKESGRVEENDQVLPEITRNLKEADCHLLARYIWHKDDPWINSQHVSYNEKIPATYVRALPNWEYVWAYYKSTPKREGIRPLNEQISKEDWKRWVSAVWYIRSVQANDDHTAKFPSELVNRLIKLYSVRGDTVFDPFLGSGTTAVEAYRTGRDYAGIERDPVYHRLSLENVSNAVAVGYVEPPFVPPPRYKPEKLF